MEDRKYISAGEKYCTRVSHVNAPVLRKKFFYKPNGKKVTAEISVAGFYRLFVNGVDVTKGYFAPAITNPDDIIYKCPEQILMNISYRSMAKPDSCCYIT